MTRLLVRLEGAGLVERRRAEHDRRVVQVTITDAGLDLLSQIDGPLNETVLRTGRHLTVAEHAELSRLLDKLRTDQA